MNEVARKISLEEGAPAENRDLFRRCLSQYATGVSIITTRSGERLAGMTSNSFASLSLDPPLVLWSIRRESRSLETFASAGHFAVNVLAVDQLELAKTFARSGDDKFGGVEWTPGIGGSPVLGGTVCSLECTKINEVEGGDHVMLIGRVERCRRFDRTPLLFAQGRYGRLYDALDGDSGVLSKMNLPSQAGSEITTSLLFNAYRAMLRLFERARKNDGLSYLEVVLLNLVNRHPGQPLEALMSHSVFDIDAGRDLAAVLVSRQLLSVEDSRYSITPEGARRLEAIVKRSAEMRREAFRDLAPEDVEAALRVINVIVTQGARAGS